MRNIRIQTLKDASFTYELCAYLFGMINVHFVSTLLLKLAIGVPPLLNVIAYSLENSQIFDFCIQVLLAVLK